MAAQGCGGGAGSPGSPDDTLIALIIRRDGTYDYVFGPGESHSSVASCLRQVADQIDSGAAIPNPTPEPPR